MSVLFRLQKAADFISGHGSRKPASFEKESHSFLLVHASSSSAPGLPLPSEDTSRSKTFPDLNHEPSASIVALARLSGTCGGPLPHHMSPWWDSVAVSPAGTLLTGTTY